MSQTWVPCEPVPDQKRWTHTTDVTPTVAFEPAATLEAVNGIGGFADDGREYVIRVHARAGTVPPALPLYGPLRDSKGTRA